MQQYFLIIEGSLLIVKEGLSQFKQHRDIQLASSGSVFILASTYLIQYHLFGPCLSLDDLEPCKHVNETQNTVLKNIALVVHVHLFVYRYLISVFLRYIVLKIISCDGTQHYIESKLKNLEGKETHSHLHVSGKHFLIQLEKKLA